jgi:MFS family permease
MNSSVSRSVALPPVLLVQFIGALGLSLVLPFLVFLVLRFGGNGLIYGLLGATYPACQMIGAPWLGTWSDRRGRRPVLLLSQAGTLLSWILFLVALHLPEQPRLVLTPPGTESFLLTLPLVGLFIARALDGLTGGNISVAQAVVADVSKPAERSRNFGRLAAASSLGFIVGPALAGLLGGTRFGASVPVAVAILVSLVALSALSLRLPETHRPAQETSRTAESHPRRHGLKDVLQLPGARLLLILYFVIFLAFNVFYTAFPVHAATALGWSPARLGVFFAVLSGLMVLVQGPVLARVAPRVSAPLLVAGGNLLLAGAFACLTLPGVQFTWICAILFALGNGLMWPTYLSVLAAVGGSEMQGAVQGHAASMGSAAAIVGLVVGGVLYDGLGAGAFWISSAVIATAGLLSGRICSQAVSAVRSESAPAT